MFCYTRTWKSTHSVFLISIFHELCKMPFHLESLIFPSKLTHRSEAGEGPSSQTPTHVCPASLPLPATFPLTCPTQTVPTHAWLTITLNLNISLRKTKTWILPHWDYFRGTPLGLKETHHTEGPPQRVGFGSSRVDFRTKLCDLNFPSPTHGQC